MRVETALECETLLCKGNGSKLKQVIINIMMNAMDALEGYEGGLIRLETRGDSNEVVLSISDNGCGIDSNDLQKIFDPFYTTKAPNKGKGLGLSCVTESFNLLEESWKFIVSWVRERLLRLG